jgi:hypothetical protein
LAGSDRSTCAFPEGGYVLSPEIDHRRPAIGGTALRSSKYLKTRRLASADAAEVDAVGIERRQPTLFSQDAYYSYGASQRAPQGAGFRACMTLSTSSFRQSMRKGPATPPRGPENREAQVGVRGAVATRLIRTGCTPLPGRHHHGSQRFHPENAGFARQAS